MFNVTRTSPKLLLLQNVKSLINPGQWGLCAFFSVNTKEKKSPNRTQLIKFLKDYGIKKDQLTNHPAIFQIPEAELLRRINILSHSAVPSDDVLLLLLLSSKDLIRFFEIIKQKRKNLEELASIFKITEKYAAQLIIKYKFLLRLNPQNVKEKVDIITAGGISLEDLLKDLWILTNSKESLSSRLQAVQELNITPIKPWIVRNNKEILQRIGAGRAEEQAALAPHTSSAELLQEELGLDDWMLQNMASRHPPVIKIHGSKLRQVIDYLIIEGFTTEQIYHTPRILSHSIDTIKERLRRLRELNYEPYTLSILCKNQKVFEEFIMKLKSPYKQEGS